jgi:hypothetical protein
MARRRELFTTWSRDRVAEIQELKATQPAPKRDARAEYLTFLGENASIKLYWPEFKRKYRKDPIMMSYDLSDKEREKIYRELVSKLKLGESDRRKELLGVLKEHKDDMKREDGVGNVLDVVRRDVRFYVVDRRKREEIVEGFMSTL